MIQTHASDIIPTRYRLRVVQPEDGPAVVQLLNQLFGHWGSLEDWLWKYHSVPTSLHLDSYLAECQGQIIGHYGILPLRATWDGETVPAAQAVDAGVLPEHRRSGVFTGLALQTLRQAAQTGSRLIYAFPGLLSLSANQRFGFRSVSFISEMMCVVNLPRALHLAVKFLPRDLLTLSTGLKQQAFSPEAIHRLVRLRRIGYLLASLLTTPYLPALKVLPQEEADLIRVDNFDHRMDAFWERYAASHSFGLVKDSRYLNWRYCNHPSHAYHITLAKGGNQITGCMVIQHTGLRSVIAELMLLPDNPSPAIPLLRSAVKQACSAGSVLLSTWAKSEQPGSRALRRMGFSTPANLITMASSLPALAQQLYQVIAFTEHLDHDQQDYIKRQMQAWSFSIGDSDLV
jgi:GNAT superfamily N-acetyltransferase